MRPLYGVPLLQLLLLLLFTCQLASPTPIFDKDGGSPSRYRSLGIRETIQDWFKMMKDKIVGKWQEWFGESPADTFSPQDILDVDKTLEKRIQGYPGIILDLSNVTLDPKRDWGVHLGNWYIIRKVAGDKFGADCDTDEWDFKSWIPTLPSFPNFDWPNVHGFGNPEPTTAATPRSEPPTTTIRREATPTVTRTEQPSTTTTGTTVSTSTSIESIPPVTRIATEAPTEPTEESSTSTQSPVPTTELSVTSAESTESITATDELDESVTSSIESTTNEPTITLTTEGEINEIEVDFTTEPSTTPIDLTLAVLGKRIEDNDIDRPTRRPNNRPSSAEVVMF